MKKYLAAIIFIFLLSADMASAVSVGVKPKEINIFATMFNNGTGELMVKNTGSEPAIYKIYADNYGRNIKVKPDALKLNPGEEGIVKITTRFILPRIIKTNISVLARSVNISQVAASPGVKIPIVVKVSPNYRLLNFFLLMLSILLAVVFMVEFKNKKIIQ
jgi:hypothetical protein